jgi:hypothetical protein
VARLTLRGRCKAAAVFNEENFSSALERALRAPPLESC